MFFLLIRDEGREPAIRRQVFAGMQIGRRKDLQCVLKDPTAGRLAAKIVEDRGVLFVEDLGSVNPTVIRGGRDLGKGEREALRHGLILEIGRSTLEIEEPPPGSTPEIRESVATGSKAAREVPSGELTLVGKAFDRGDSMEPLAQTIVHGEAPPVPAVQVLPQPVAAELPSPSEFIPAPPVPASDRFESGSEVVGTGTIATAPKPNDPAAQTTMWAHKPRIVIADEADRRVVPLRKIVSIIARKRGECTIDNPGVSEPHAEISFIPQTNSFQIVDQGSRNHTLVGGLALTPMSPHLLAPECLLCFGQVQAVFVVAHDSDNAPIPPRRYEAALRMLVDGNQVTPQQLSTARERALLSENHAGVELLIAGVVTARAWTKAFESARRFEESAPPMMSRRLDRRLVSIAIAIVAGLSLLAWFLRHKLGF